MCVLYCRGCDDAEQTRMLCQSVELGRGGRARRARRETSDDYGRVRHRREREGVCVRLARIETVNRPGAGTAGSIRLETIIRRAPGRITMGFVNTRIRCELRGQRQRRLLNSCFAFDTPSLPSKRKIVMPPPVSYYYIKV